MFWEEKVVRRRRVVEEKGGIGEKVARRSKSKR